MCDNCIQAVYELEIQRGNGIFDYGRLKRILEQTKDPQGSFPIEGENK